MSEKVVTTIAAFRVRPREMCEKVVTSEKTAPYRRSTIRIIRLQPFFLLRFRTFESTNKMMMSFDVLATKVSFTIASLIVAYSVKLKRTTYRFLRE
jgi:hypothetical protein